MPSGADPLPQTTISFPDTHAGREAFRRYLIERFGPQIEYRPTVRGIEIRTAKEDENAE